MFFRIKRWAIEREWLVPTGKGACILAYHGVDLSGDTRFNKLHIGARDFEAQLAYLKKYYQVVSVEDFYEGRYDADRFAVALTFDDGRRNNFTYALPLLEKYGLPATFYATGLRAEGEEILWTDLHDLGAYFHEDPISIEGRVFVKKNGRFVDPETGQWVKQFIKSDDRPGYVRKKALLEAFGPTWQRIRTDKSLADLWELMSDDEIRAVGKSTCVRIGSHGYWHNNLGNLPPADAAAELERSKRYLENLVQREVPEVAYPDGSYSRGLVPLAADLGFRYQLAVRFHFPEDASTAELRDRSGVYPWTANKTICYMATHGPRQ